MSTDTQNSRTSGDSRRRRSRGGQNRRNNNNNSDSNRSEGRQSGGGKREGGHTGRQSTGAGKPQRRPMPAPAKLTWWEKVKKMLGLYKEPVRPPRPERRPDVTEPKKTREPRQTKTREPRQAKTRDARTENREDRSEQKDSRDGAESPRRGKRKERNSGPRGGDPSTVENRRVYVGNLSYDTTESDIEELFKGVGAVRRVEIVYNRTTHRSKGYGFVEMIDIDEAKRTVEVLHDQFFMGRQLTVSGAKSKDHEDAENEEGANERQNNVLPPVAPINPAKEQVLDLIEEPKAEVSTEEPHAEIPTEEFSPEADTEEEKKEQPNA